MIACRGKILGLINFSTVAAVLGCLLAGCQSVAPARTAAEAKLVPPTKIILGPGDTIEIKFAYASQFNETFTIRPDGKVELQLIGEIIAQGKTPDALREEMIERYAEQLQHPQLAVIVRTLQERRVYVGGEVKQPGVITIPGDLTALEAVVQAGGFNAETAETENVVVVRRDEDGRQYGYALNLKDVITGQETEPFYLAPRDIVYVPRIKIAEVNQWVQQHFWRMLPPFSMGIGFTPF